MTKQLDLFSDNKEDVEDDRLKVYAEKPNKYGFFCIRSSEDLIYAFCEMRPAYIRVFRWVVPYESSTPVNEHYLSLDVIAKKMNWRLQNVA